MKYKIVDKNNFTLDIQGMKYYDISGSKRDIKNTTIDRFNQFGANLISSLFFGEKKFDITIDLPTTNDELYLSTLNSIGSFFVENRKPFYLVEYSNINNIRRLEISPSGLDESHTQGLLARLTKIKISLLSLNGLWESDLISQSGVLNPNDVINITLPNFAFDSYFGIELEATDIVPNDEFFLEHIQNSKSIFIKDLFFTQGNKFYIDGRGKGRLNFNSVNRDKSLFSGNFFPFTKGLNTIRYVGVNPVNYILDYRIRTEF